MTHAERRDAGSRWALRALGRPDAAVPERRLAATLREQQAEGARLDTLIVANLREVGYGG